MAPFRGRLQEYLDMGKLKNEIKSQGKTIKDADKIIVLDEGKICESGTHTELLKLGRQYAELFNAQQSNLK